MTYEEPEKPEPQGCGDWREANKFPTILISPTPEIKKPENEGCGELEKLADKYMVIKIGRI